MSQRMTQEELDRLRELHEQATPGRWHLDPVENMIIAGDNPNFEEGAGGEEIGISYYGPRTKAGKANKALLTQARNALPGLLDEISHLKAELERNLPNEQQ